MECFLNLSLIYILMISFIITYLFSDKKSGSEDEAGDGEGDEVEGEDEEMDGGTDYANNYFDNGEGEDEEDNLEEGGVY